MKKYISLFRSRPSKILDNEVSVEIIVEIRGIFVEIGTKIMKWDDNYQSDHFVYF